MSSKEMKLCTRVLKGDNQGGHQVAQGWLHQEGHLSGVDLQVVIVKKVNDKWRICIDFIEINRACPKYGYSLLRID